MRVTDQERKWLKNIFQNRVFFDEPMSRHTTIHAGGPATILVFPTHEYELKTLLEWNNQKGMRYKILGAGSNVIVKDGGFQGMIIGTKKGFNHIIFETNAEDVQLRVGAGTKLPKLSKFTINNGLSGMIFALGIPGTVGGAIVMNAGTKDGNIGQVLHSITIMTGQGEKFIIPKKKIVSSYRLISWEHKEDNQIILEGIFKLSRGAIDQLKSKARQQFVERLQSQPFKKKSAGCFFKNPKNGFSAGQLIDMAGFKGKRVGGAMVSPIHANFIINHNHATTNDILKLAYDIQETICHKFHIQLEPEVQIIGEETIRP